LVQKGTGALNLDDPEQKADFDFFFGPNRQMDQTPKIETFIYPGTDSTRLPIT